MRSDKKGIAEILTTFFLILVMVGIAIAFVSFNKGFLLLQHQVNSQLEVYTTAHLVRNHMTSCFGLVIEWDQIGTGTCLDGSAFDEDILRELIRGYEIRRMDHYGCSEDVHEWSGDEVHKMELRYFMPIKESSVDPKQVCLGEMTIKI